jgi:hypothetical protein
MGGKKKSGFLRGKIEAERKKNSSKKKKKKFFLFLFFLFFFFPLHVTNTNLVDPASSHMLVLKIKPCMSKYKHLYCETANGSLNQL